MPTRRRNRQILAAAVVAALPVLSGTAQAVDASQPAILQMFEATYKTMERRAPDIFMAGYGGLWTPPPGRADQGNLSVGYDVYDRFDLGSAGNPTLYGTETGLKQTVVEMHKSSVNVYTDLVWNHNGFSDKNTAGFQAAGAYPGFVIQNGADTWGDFHNYGDSGDLQGRLSGLIDIAQEKNHQYTRSPVPGFANNIPAGTVPFAGRLANVATEANRRFYPNQQGPSFTVNDPATGAGSVTYYAYDTANPSTGDPVSENATGYLMRQARWMVETIGVDGFRLDAAKHLPTWAWNYYDQAVFRAGDRKYLDGATNKYVFSFGESIGDKALIQSYIRKDISSAATVGGNRDALDFPMHYALKENLSGNGTQNSWFNIVNASQDSQDDSLANNGSQGVSFDASHDDGGAYLGNVASAYLLMRPGNSIVYMNAKQFGNGRSFPKDGRGDALGGFYGNTITKLVDIRNTHGRGNYQERWLDKETLVYERQKGLIAGYNNRVDNGYDQRTVNTFFDPGMHLVELTGNATNGTVDPNNDIFDTVVVQPNGQITIRIPRNKNPNGVEHDKGYVIYGPATPQGTLVVTNSRAIAGETGTAANNGTVRLTGFDVVSANNFEVQLQTTAVVLSDGFNDLDAAGDNAVLRFDGGLNINGNGGVDFTSPNGSAYGFENFVTEKSPKYGGGSGLYRQAIDATALSEGFHYVTARAYRHQNVAGTPLWTDFRKVVYVDRVRTTSSISDMLTISGQPDDRDIIIKSNDKTADRVHFWANVGSSQYTIDQLVSMAWSGTNQAGEYDRDLFKYGVFDMKNGNQAFTIVSFEPSFDPALGYAGGGVNVQRIVVPFANGGGLGLGDLTWNGVLASDDQTQMLTLLGGNSNPINPNTSFNPAADLNADGTITEADNVLMVPWLTHSGASASTITTATSNRLARALVSGQPMDIPSGTLNVSGTNVSGTPLTFNSGFNITANKTLTKTGGETLNVNGVQIHGSNSVLITAGGVTNINTNAGQSNQNLTMTTTGAGSTTNLAVTQRLKALNINTGGSVNLNTSTGALVNGLKVINTQSLSIAGGKLDLKNNNLAVNYTGASVIGAWTGGAYDGVTGHIADGRGDGSWNGPTGITSSIAQEVTTTLAVAEAADVLGLSGADTATWYGQTVDATTVLVKYTWGGDADLNGELNGDDYFYLDSNILANQAGANNASFHNGDFDYNGELNGDDYFILDSNILFASGQIMAGSGAGGSGFAAVPEPASLGMLLAAAGFASTRRRRHNGRSRQE